MFDKIPLSHFLALATKKNRKENIFDHQMTLHIADSFFRNTHTQSPTNTHIKFSIA